MSPNRGNFHTQRITPIHRYNPFQNQLILKKPKKQKNNTRRIPSFNNMQVQQMFQGSINTLDLKMDSIHSQQSTLSRQIVSDLSQRQRTNEKSLQSSLFQSTISKNRQRYQQLKQSQSKEVSPTGARYKESTFSTRSRNFCSQPLLALQRSSNLQLDRPAQHTYDSFPKAGDDVPRTSTHSMLGKFVKSGMAKVTHEQNCLCDLSQLPPVESVILGD